jgi:peptidoglycan/xylan/chitin deacetylase (PgdA/CDA1 family)
MPAIEAARWRLDGLPVQTDDAPAVDIVPSILTEAQFGPNHFRLSRAKRMYYRARPFLPASLRPLLHRLHAGRKASTGPLRWPIDDRYVRFQFEVVRHVLNALGRQSASHLDFWPSGARFAFVLTHDVEGPEGQAFVRSVADLEERYGFRSSFNFVAADYALDRGLMAELVERGFEVGVHGWHHDGKLFASHARFSAQAKSINRVLAEWGAGGFRSPQTHRQPAWMQALDVAYDSSFFDTDPYEPIAGGVLSIWPFFLGRFVELPYTLPQDHTLVWKCQETTPRIWLEKLGFIEQYRGMALLNSHPDYLREPRCGQIYEDFLRAVQPMPGYWHALPRQVARWWRLRSR